MRYRITITEVDGDDPETGNVIVRYEQTVDSIDMQAIIAAVNTPFVPRLVRQRAQRSDAGKPRRKEEEVV